MHRRAQLRVAVLGAVLLLGLKLTGCDTTDPPTPTSVVVNPTTVNLDAIGGTQQLTGEVLDQSDEPMPDETLEWSSDDETVVTVNANGLVTAVANGATDVWATSTSSGLQASAAVTVAQIGTILQQVSGNAQTDTVGQTLPDSLVVRLLDRLSQPVADATVNFAVTAGNGMRSPASATTDALGRAATAFTLGTTSGTNHRVQASRAGASSPPDFTATALPGPADTAVKIQGDAQTGGVGFALSDSIVVRVEDEFGNPVAGHPVDFVVAAGHGAANPDFADTGAGGLAATEWTVGPDVGEDTLRATAVGLPELVFTATVQDIGPPANITVHEGDGQTGLAGFAVNIPPSVLVTDGSGVPVSGVDVAFTVASGGGSVTGGDAVTDPSGIATIGSWTLGSTPGSNTLDASVTNVGSVTFTATGATADYDIDVRFLSTVSMSQEQAFLDAAARWGELIFGDLLDIPVDIAAGQCGSNSPAINETVDDLLIFATIDSIDGPGGILGQAGPCFIRNADSLTVVGLMRFDSADVANLEGSGNLDDVILHEMGHVIGLGTLWNLFGLLTGGGTVDPYFTGARAIEAFDRIGGADYAGNKVPVENTGGSGTRDSHWRESVFDNELMTGFIDATNPLSEVTTASFWDLGYLVNLDGSDGFVIMTALKMAGGLKVELVDDVVRLPIHVLDSRGRIVNVIPIR